MTHRLSLNSYDVADAGDAAGLTLTVMAGLWTLRFGAFGCRDEETHGGVLHVEGARMAGGDAHLIFHGQFTLDGGALTASLQVVRHGNEASYPNLFGTDAPLFRLNVVADAITRDLFEGRIQRQGGPAIRVTMRRFQPMGENSRMV